MYQSVYEIESQVELTHWWFIGRRKLISKIISKLSVPLESTVLDIGTSTGTNLRLFSGLGYKNVTGIDIADESIKYCSRKPLGAVIQGDACNLPFKNKQFSLILATDIIEHINDDSMALLEIKRVLGDKGHAIITVPAFGFLWGIQDVVSEHKRRYRKVEFSSKIQNAGLYCTECFYFNYLLFLPILFARQLMNLLRIKVKSENEVNSPVLNYLLSSIFLIDIMYAQKIKLPFGVSILAIVKK